MLQELKDNWDRGYEDPCFHRYFGSGSTLWETSWIRICMEDEDSGGKNPEIKSVPEEKNELEGHK